MKKLLNIDGGGVRVYFPLLILNYIEKKTNKKIIDLFDYFAGVSASSILLSALLTKYSVDELLCIFKDLTKKIFYKSYYQSISSGFGLFYSKYPDYYVNKELEEFFKDYKLSDVKKPLSILTYNLETSKPLCFHSYKNDNIIPLWKVIRGSTSAPTYFPSFRCDTFSEEFIPSNYSVSRDSYNLIDGGVVCNNLSELTFINALSYFGTNEEFIQLSLGTGEYIHSYNSSSSGLLSWSSNIIDILFSASSLSIVKSMKSLSKVFNIEHFYRINIELKNNIFLDDCNSFDYMDKLFEEWLPDNKEKLDMICEKLLL